MNTDRVNECIHEVGMMIQELMDDLSFNERLAFTNSLVSSLVKSMTIAALRPEEDEGDEGDE